MLAPFDNVGQMAEIDELLISVILATDMSTNLECCAKFRRTQMANTTPKRNSLRSM